MGQRDIATKFAVWHPAMHAMVVVRWLPPDLTSEDAILAASEKAPNLKQAARLRKGRKAVNHLLTCP